MEATAEIPAARLFMADRSSSGSVLNMVYRLPRRSSVLDAPPLSIIWPAIALTVVLRIVTGTAGEFVEGQKIKALAVYAVRMLVLILH